MIAANPDPSDPKSPTQTASKSSDDPSGRSSNQHTNKGVFFLKQFISRPGKVGAFAPSSGYLAQAMIGRYALSDAKSVLELGPGTGALTKHIVPRLGSRTQFNAIELNEEFVRILKDEFPHQNIHLGSATDSLQILKEQKLESAEYIISGLPWASFDPELQNALLKAVLDCLPDGGKFTTFAYSAAAWLPRGKRFRKLLEDNFSEVSRSAVVWRNLPPAFAYHCVK